MDHIWLWVFCIITSRISGRGHRIGAVFLFVCVWALLQPNNKLCGKRTLKYPMREVRECSGVFIWKIRPCAPLIYQTLIDQLMCQHEGTSHPLCFVTFHLQRRSIYLYCCAILLDNIIHWHWTIMVWQPWASQWCYDVWFYWGRTS